MLGAAVAQIVAVHRGDHHVLQPQVGDGDGQVGRLVDVQRLRPAMTDVAERAASGADIAHDHEGRGAAGEALAQVRAGRLFADAVQLVLAQQLLDAVDLGETGMRTRIQSGFFGSSSVGMIFTGIRATFSAPRSFTPTSTLPGLASPDFSTTVLMSVRSRP